MSKKIQSMEDLLKLKNQAIEIFKKYKYIVNLCGGAGCVSSDSILIKEALEKELELCGFGFARGFLLQVT